MWMTNENGRWIWQMEMPNVDGDWRASVYILSFMTINTLLCLLMTHKIIVGILSDILFFSYIDKAISDLLFEKE